LETAEGVLLNEAGRRVGRLGVEGDLSFTVEAPLGTQKFTFQGDATLETLRDALDCRHDCLLFAASLETVVKGVERACPELPHSPMPLANIGTRLVSMLRDAGKRDDPILGLHALLRGLLWTPPSTKQPDSPDSDSVAAQSGLLALEKQHRVIVHATTDPGMVSRYGDPLNMLSTSLLPSPLYYNLNGVVFDASKCQAFAGAEDMDDLWTRSGIAYRYTKPEQFFAEFIKNKSSAPGGVPTDQPWRHVYFRQDQRPVDAQNGDITWVDDQADMLSRVASGYAEYMRWRRAPMPKTNEVLATCPLAAFLGMVINPEGRDRRHQRQWAVQLQIAAEKLNRSLFWLSPISSRPFVSGLRIVDVAMPGNLGELSDVQRLGLKRLDP